LKPNLRLLLIAQQGMARRAYESALNARGMVVDTVSDIDSFFRAVTHTAYNGVLVDIPTKVLALKNHRDLVNSILSHYPVIQLNIERVSGRIRALRLGHTEDSGTLEDLLTADTLLPLPKRFRGRRRQKRHYNVLVSETPEAAQTGAFQSVTVDLSEEGCFLFYAGKQDLPDTLWLRFLELTDPEPILVSVRRRIRWGESMRIPGVGVKFVLLSESQRGELMGFGSPFRSSNGKAAPIESTRRGR
jgi:hypothetical protein